MPYPKLWTDEQILRLYNEYQQSDEDLKTFCEKRGLDYFTIEKRFTRLERRLARGGPPIISTPEGVVASAVQSEIASRAKKMVDSQLGLGKDVHEEIVAILTEEGRLHEIDKINPREEIRKWYKAYKELPKIKKENEELSIQLNYYKRRADPFKRLEIALNAYINYLAIAVIAKRMGTNISETKQTFHNMLTNFLKGGEVEFNG